MDTGIGISEGQMKIIFEPFRQASEGLGRIFEGTGLGLTLCKQFVELMDGEISVESKLGQGSTFILRFPIPESGEKQGESERSVKLGEILHKGQKAEVWPELIPNILIVEDNPLNCDLTARFLEDAALIDKAYDGFEALTMAKSRVYDVVLMDIHLSSEMDGLQTTAELRKLPGYETIPIIAITGYSTLKERDIILSGGLTYYIAKPFDKPSLRKLVMTALAESQTQSMPLSSKTGTGRSAKSPGA